MSKTAKIYVILLCTVLAMSAVLPTSAVYADDNVEIEFSHIGDGVVDITFTNNTGSAAECRIVSAVRMVQNDRIVWSNNEIYTAQTGLSQKRIIPDIHKNGSYKYEITVYYGNKSYAVTDGEYYVINEKVKKAERIGIQADTNYSDEGIEEMAEAGLGWITLEVRWDEVEKVKNNPDIANVPEFISAVEKARECGLDVAVLLFGNNSLYGDASSGIMPVSTDEQDGFANFCGYMAENLSGYGVNTFCIWNEPNNIYFNDTARINFEKIVSLQQKAYDAIKNVSQNTTVIGGRIAGGCNNNNRYILTTEVYTECLFNYGIGNYIDAFSIHPYMAWDGPVDEASETFLLPYQISNLKNIMSKYECDKPIWITEVGYCKDLADADVAENFKNVTEAEKGAYNARTAIVAMADDRIERVIFYSMQASNWAFLNPKTKLPQDSYYSVAAAAEFMGDKKIIASDTEDSSYSTYMFGDENEYVIALWAKGSRADSKASLPLSEILSGLGVTDDELTAVYYDTFGNNAKLITADDAVVMSYQPAYIRLCKSSAQKTGSTTTITGISSGQYAGIMVRDSSGSIIYCNQESVSGGFEFSFDTNTKAPFTATVFDKSYSLTKRLNELYGKFSGIRIEDAEIENLSGLENGEVTFVLESVNTTGEEQAADGILAYYDGERLLDIAITNVKIPMGNAQVSINIPNELPEGCNLAKCMIINLGTMQPLAAAKKLTD